MVKFVLAALLWLLATPAMAQVCPGLQIGPCAHSPGLQQSSQSVFDLSQYHLTFAENFSAFTVSATGQGTTWAYNKPDNQNFGQIGYNNFTVSGGVLTIP